MTNERVRYIDELCVTVRNRFAHARSACLRLSLAVRFARSALICSSFFLFASRSRVRGDSAGGALNWMLPPPEGSEREVARSARETARFAIDCCRARFPSIDTCARLPATEFTFASRLPSPFMSRLSTMLKHTSNLSEISPEIEY